MEDECIEDRDDIPNYSDPDQIDVGALSQALGTLRLLGTDVYLRIQAFNLSIVDHFIMRLEHQMMLKRFEEDKEDLLETSFLSAQTQMWIFAAYELLRTWRARAKDVVRLSQNGGLAMKADALGKELPFLHPGRKARAEQLRQIIGDPSIVEAIARDIRRTHILFSYLTHVRVALAKHEVSSKPNSVAYAPGFGTFNRYSGSLEYEVGQEGTFFTMISRRELAEYLRGLSNKDDLPSEEEISSFDLAMKGPTR